MDGGAAQYNPRTVEEVFRDYKARRAALIKALTTDVEEFFQQCDPEKENLCLYGHPNEQWEVNLPVEEVPPEIPEPALGINFARDGMEEKDWLALVAVHSDAWLLAVAFYFGARFGFDKAGRAGLGLLDSTLIRMPHVAASGIPARLNKVKCSVPITSHGSQFMKAGARPNRKRLFSMINELPSVYEVMNGKSKVRTANSNHSNNKPKSNSRVFQKSSESQPKYPKGGQPKEEGGLGEEDEHGETLCGACGENYAADEFWICCDVCERWFHGKCVKITPARAEHIKQYKCPSCSSNKRARPS